MKYVIFNKKIGNYLNPSGNTFLAISPNKGALKFKNILSALNYFTNFEESIRENLVIKDIEGNNIDFQKETEILLNNKNFFISDFYDIVEENISALILMLKQQLFEQDSATQDILHKVEFDYLTAEEKINIINKLHNIRQKRRIIKDKINYLEIINKYKDPIVSMGQELKTLFENQKNREYTPKILKELFKEE